MISATASPHASLTLNQDAPHAKELTKTPFDVCAASNESKSTILSSLGKRLRQASGSSEDCHLPLALQQEGTEVNFKRAKTDLSVEQPLATSEAADGTGLIQIKCMPQPTRTVKSAPISNNGSTNAFPVLDICVQLPVGDVNSSEEPDNEDNSLDRREKRLKQNRKSAQKCRQKKKEQIGTLRERFDQINNQNDDLKFQINNISLMLYQKIEENQQLMGQIDQAQAMQTQQIAVQNLLMLAASQNAAQQQPVVQNQPAKVVPVKIQQGSCAPPSSTSNILNEKGPQGPLSNLLQKAMLPQPTSSLSQMARPSLTMQRSSPTASVSAFKQIVVKPVAVNSAAAESRN